MRYAIAALGAALLFAGCGQKIDNNNKDAVRQGVLEYLNGKKMGMDPSKVNIEVTEVKFNKDEADAVVSFTPKDSAIGGMSMNYKLERKGSAWVVKGRKESAGGGGHGAAMPGAMPQMPPVEPGAAMPPGHPPTPEKK